MNAFHVFGSLLAIWAVVVAFLGITREGFPSSKGVERAIQGITVVLVALAIVTGATTAGHEDEGHGRGEQPEATAALFA